MVGIFASGDQCSIAFTPPYLGFPTDVLDGFGLFFQAQLQVATDLGWVAIGPRSFDEAPTGMGIPGFGNGPLPASLPIGGFRRGQAQIVHELSGILAGQVAEFGHRGDSAGALHPAQRLQGLGHRVEAPGFDLRLAR
jgi:hypothetical protein